MKKLLMVAMMLVILGVSGMSFANEPVGSQDETTFTLHGMYLEPNVEAFLPFNDDLDASVFAGGKGGYQWNEWFALEVELGWANPDFTGGMGSVTTIPLLFNARVNLWPGVYMVDTYLFGGIGIAFNSIDVNVPNANIDDSLAGQIGGGAEYRFNESFSAYLDLRFYFSDPDLNVVVLGSKDVSLTSFLIGGGIVWRF